MLGAFLRNSALLLILAGVVAGCAQTPRKNLTAGFVGTGEALSVAYEGINRACQDKKIDPETCTAIQSIWNDARKTYIESEPLIHELIELGWDAAEGSAEYVRYMALARQSAKYLDVIVEILREKGVKI
ncbi:MAG: hypothetical protein MRJ65_06970 [Candidatus Brocadiaceae bacterium]|nr:hypothetical protein [Candidatus Brocadiaceae bacterium]